METAASVLLAEKSERFKIVRLGERQPIPGELRFAIAYRDKYKCKWCGSRRPLEIDHIIPWSAGGPDIDTNLRVLCKPCNQRRSNFRTDENAPDISPLTIQCLRCGGGDPDSTVTNAFCLVCGRLGATRADQLRTTRRYRWAENMDWLGWKARLQVAQSDGYWSYWTAATDKGPLQ
jgi:hypothetical protein